jgi:tetratricopeptide (TPR) repeat protein
MGYPYEAIENYDKAIERDPNFVEAWNNKGTVLCELGDYQAAIENYDKAIEANPNEPSIWYYRARCNVRKGDMESALKDLNKSVEIGGEKFINLYKEDEFLKGINIDK